MKKIPFYMGLGLIMVQALIIGIYFLSQVSVSQTSLDTWALIFLVVPINLAAFTMLFFGLASK